MKFLSLEQAWADGVLQSAEGLSCNEHGVLHIQSQIEGVLHLEFSGTWFLPGTSELGLYWEEAVQRKHDG